MSDDITEGTKVTWSWGAGTGEGTVTEVHREKVTRTIKGSEITRNATGDEPAFSIETDDGDEVLKSVTELDEA